MSVQREVQRQKLEDVQGSWFLMGKWGLLCKSLQATSRKYLEALFGSWTLVQAAVVVENKSQKTYAEDTADLHGS